MRQSLDMDMATLTGPCLWDSSYPWLSIPGSSVRMWSENGGHSELGSLTSLTTWLLLSLLSEGGLLRYDSYSGSNNCPNICMFCTKLNTL